MAPPPHGYALAGGWAGLGLLGLVQRFRYMSTAADSAAGNSEHIKVLSQADANIALATEQDAAFKQTLQENGGLAARAAFFIMLAASPVLSKQVHEWFHFMAYDTTYTAVLIMWTMDRTIGKTTAAIWDAILGTFMSFLFIFFISGFFPGGVHEGDPGGSPVWWIGMAYLLITVIGMLHLKFPNGVRVWCLSYHMGNMMHFLKPKPADAPAIFSESFHINPKGQMFGYMVITILACGMSVFAVSLPTPKSSHRAALEKIGETKREFCTVFRNMVRLYLDENGKDTKSACTRSKMYRMRIQANLDEMDGDVAYAWWEHFDRGFYGDVRHMLGMHVAMSRKLVRNVEALESGLSSELGTDAEKRSKLLAEIKQPLLTMQTSMLNLFERVTEFTMDGDVDEEEAGSLLNLVASVEGDMLSFSSVFRAAVARLAGDSFVSRHAAFKDEYHMVFVLCTMARQIVDLGKELAKREPLRRTSLFGILGGSLRNIVAGMRDEAHQAFASRNSLSLLLCFFLGYVGNGSLIPRYTADIATNASLLLSSFVGSALQKNMGRVQGLVIGSVVGRVIHALLSMSDCGSSAYGVSMVATLGVFSMVSYYLFVSSPTFGFTAYLFGGFGSMVILGDCSATENTESAYLAITCATLCIIVMAGVDLSMAPSAAEDTTKSYFEFLRGKKDVLSSLLKQARLPHGHDTDELMGLLAGVKRSADEAAKAPSMVARPFGSALFEALLGTGKQSLIHIDTLSHAMLVQPDERSPDATPSKYRAGVSPVTQVFSTCKSFEEVSDTMDGVLLSAFLLAETSITAPSSIEAIHSSKDIVMKSASAKEQLEQLAKEVGAETDGKFKDTVIPLDQDTDTALQVSFKEMDMIVTCAEEIKMHSMTHV